MTHPPFLFYYLFMFGQTVFFHHRINEQGDAEHDGCGLLWSRKKFSLVARLVLPFSSIPAKTPRSHLGIAVLLKVNDSPAENPRYT